MAKKKTEKKKATTNKTLVEKFIDSSPENKKLFEEEMGKLEAEHRQLADSEIEKLGKHITELSKLLSERDKEIVELREENNKLRTAQHYGKFN